MTSAANRTRLPAETEKALWMRNYLIECRTVGEATGESLTVLEFTVQPADGPPLHVHHNEDETYYVLDGTFFIQVGTDSYEVGPGGCVFGPRNVVHGFVNSSDGPGRLLVIATPAGMERYHEEAGHVAPARTPPPEAGGVDLQLAAALAEKYRFEVVGPPLHVEKERVTR